MNQRGSVFKSHRSLICAASLPQLFIVFCFFLFPPHFWELHTSIQRVWTCPSLSTGRCGQEPQQLRAPPSAVAPMLRCGRRGLPPSPAKTEPTCAGGHLLESRSPAAGLLNKASLRSDRRSPGELLAQLLAGGTVSGNEALQRCRSPR